MLKVSSDQLTFCSQWKTKPKQNGSRCLYRVIHLICNSDNDQDDGGGAKFILSVYPVSSKDEFRGILGFKQNPRFFPKSSVNCEPSVNSGIQNLIDLNNLLIITTEIR